MAVAGCLERISRAFGAELPPQDAVDQEMFPLRVYWPHLFIRSDTNRDKRFCWDFLKR